MSGSVDLEALVESQLNLQIEISYFAHLDFLQRHGLQECKRVLDIGTGNGVFCSRLAVDHPGIEFVGIDKRRHCVENAQKIQLPNFSAEQLDMFSRQSPFEFQNFDGFLMRYFLLHVDSSRKILEKLKTSSKRPTRFWVIDLDFSRFQCSPPHPAFEKLTALVKSFCFKTSVDSLAGQRVIPLLEEAGYQNILVEQTSFSSKSITREKLALYLKQEVLCYSIMSGRSSHDLETAEIVKFLDEEFKAGKCDVDYGMVQVSAELPS